MSFLEMNKLVSDRSRASGSPSIVQWYLNQDTGQMTPQNFRFHQSFSFVDKVDGSHELFILFLDFHNLFLFPLFILALFFLFRFWIIDILIINILINITYLIGNIQCGNSKKISILPLIKLILAVHRRN